MRKYIYGALAMLSAVVLAGASVNSSEYVREHGYSRRSDGVYQRRDTKGLDVHINGYRQMSIGSQCVYEDFTEYGAGDYGCLQSDLTDCSGSDGEVNYVSFPSGNKMMVVLIGDQTQPAVDAGSFDLAGDQANDEGAEFLWGVGEASGAPFIIGESNAFYTCARLTIEDASGTDDFMVGFRRYEAHDAAIDNNNDQAAIGIIGSANPNNIYIATADDGGSHTETDTTQNWADGATHKLCTYISAAGVVTYTIDDSAPVTTAAFTWDDADPVIPFIYLLQHSDLTGEVDLLEWEVGYGTHNRGD